MSAIRVAAVVAMAENGMIGRDGGLPWRLPTDLKFFRRTTLDKPIVMGRRTYQSIGRPLDRRTNIVVTRDRSFAADGIVVAHDLETALQLARKAASTMGADEVAIIGGAEIYRAALAVTDRVYLTVVHATPEGDTSLPPFSETEWREVSRERVPAGPNDDHDMSFVVLDRVDLVCRQDADG